MHSVAHVAICALEVGEFSNYKIQINCVKKKIKKKKIDLITLQNSKNVVAGVHAVLEIEFTFVARNPPW